jgi:hypothetical protein
VRWFNKRKKDVFEGFSPSTQIETKNVPLSTLYRWFLFDVNIDDPNKYAKDAGFTPISDEGVQMELEDSTRRLARVVPFKDFLGIMSSIMSEVFAESVATEALSSGLIDEADDVDKQIDIIKDVCISLSMTAMVPTIAAALELGILQVPSNFIGSRDSL